MDPIPQLLIDLVLKYEPNAIKKNTLQYVKYFIHLMEGHLSFTFKHGLMILDKDGNIFPYIKFIRFLQLDLKEMFDKFRNNKNPQMSKSQWNECYKSLYDKANPKPPLGHPHKPEYVSIQSKIKNSIQKQKDTIIDDCIQEITNHPNTTWRYSDRYNLPTLKDNWNPIGWNYNRAEMLYTRLELYSSTSSSFQWRAVETEDYSFEKITEEVKGIEAKYKQKINQMNLSMKDEDFHPDKINSIISYMEGILFNGESEMDNTISQGTHKNGYVRKITGGLEGEFDYKFNKRESIYKFLKEIEMYLK